jgi:hypothetical protein
MHTQLINQLGSYYNVHLTSTTSAAAAAPAAPADDTKMDEDDKAPQGQGSLGGGVSIAGFFVRCSVLVESV